MRPLDQTNDPALTSWVETANEPDTDFPIQNLPFGVFRRADSDESPRVGVAIGDSILDLEAAHAISPLPGGATFGASLNGLLAESPAVRRELRSALSALLSEGGPAELIADCLVPRAGAEMFVPAKIGDFTDFYASMNHATNAGRMFRPDNPLLSNYKWMPIAYHARASSIVPSASSKAPATSGRTWVPRRAWTMNWSSPHGWAPAMLWDRLCRLPRPRTICSGYRF